MDFKISWIGEVGLGLITPEGREIGLSLEENQCVPVEFNEGDEVAVSNHPDHPALLAVGRESGGYYEITHIRSGKMLKVWHRADMFRVER